MGKDGIAYLFVCPDQGEPLTAIENLTNKIVTPMRVEGFEPHRPMAQPSARELFNNTGVPREPELAAW
jgi:ATP-dependent RNA helicase DeaD